MRPEAQKVLDLEAEMLKRFHLLLERKMTALRPRVHGAYHQGQVLYTDKGIMVIDFEDEPACILQERRQNCSPFQDEAGMLRFFHQAFCNHCRSEHKAF